MYAQKLIEIEREMDYADCMAKKRIRTPAQRERLNECARLRRAQNPEAHREYQREWRSRNPRTLTPAQKERKNLLARVRREDNPIPSREANRQWKTRNLAKARESGRIRTAKYRLQKPARQLYLNALYRAKRDGIPFSLKRGDIEIPECCPVLGIPLIVGSDKRDNIPTLDRIDNSKGYIKGNVRVISHRANRLKSDATIEEMKRILRYMENDLDLTNEADQRELPNLFASVCMELSPVLN